MAKINFNQINTGSDSNFQVGFFSLKNDGDEAIVRIMHDSTDSFDLVTTHPIQLGSRYRRVNCIRDPRDPMDNCPLCKAGSKIEQRFYIHLIQYVKDDSGNVVAQATIWERSASYAVTIKNLIDEYGPLSDCIFKIRRSGEAGSMQTKYSILYGNPQVYRPEFYPKDESLFEGYSVVGTAVLDKSFDEISEFMVTGEFPDRQTNDSQSSTNSYPEMSPQNPVPSTSYNIPNYAPSSNPYPVSNTPPQYNDASNTYVPNPSTTVRDTAVNPSMPSNQDTTNGFQRPVRYY